MSAPSLAQGKGWECRRLLEHVSALRSVRVCDLQLLSLLRAMLKLQSSAVCGSQLQASAPEQQREEGLQHRGRQGSALAACQRHKLRSAAASPKFPLAFLKSAARLFGCWRSQKEREVGEVQTSQNPLAPRVLAAFEYNIREQLLI